MDKIFIGIFVVAIVPYLGLPHSYDVWISLVGILFLLFAIYRFVVDNDIKFVLPQDNDDDFLQDTVGDEEETEAEEVGEKEEQGEQDEEKTSDPRVATLLDENTQEDEEELRQ